VSNREVRRVSELEGPWIGFWNECISEVLRHRGGEELLREIQGPHSHETGALLRPSGDFWEIESGTHPAGFALVQSGVLKIMWVTPAWRRKGLARFALDAILSHDGAPSDGLVLPGDRATKSLYESIGWKARLLTMRGGKPVDERS
jgi:GNAT superfamily N-acetyltransferase